MVRAAIQEDPALSRRSVSVFAQGSYRNGTNVRQESDVDIGVLYDGSFFTDYSRVPGLSDGALGLGPGTYPYRDFKIEVESALRRHFGSSAVSRGGGKALAVHETSARVDADVLPCFEHRRYLTSTYHEKGVQFLPDNGGSIVNWPEQQHQNGIEKNSRTLKRFKKATRILKRLRYLMEDEGSDAAKPIPSFLIECLMWNVPDWCYATPSLTEDLKNVVAFAASATASGECGDWPEENARKYLFRPSQPWTIEQARVFLLEAGARVGFW